MLRLSSAWRIFKKSEAQHRSDRWTRGCLFETMGERVNAARLNVVFEDERLLVLNKPAGLVCHPTKGDEFSSLVSRVKMHLGGASSHLVNRLDRETSGLVVIAKDDDGARELRRAWEARAVRKVYQAIAHGHVAGDGVVRAALGKDVGSAVAIKDCVVGEGAPVETRYRVVRRFSRAEGEFSLLEIEPQAGRKHQIRIHLAHLGHPIVGDKIYGADERIYLAFVEGRMTDDQWRQMILPHQALHSERLEFVFSGSEKLFQVEPEEWFSEFLEAGVCEANTT